MNNVIRKVTPGGTISTVAGNGTGGFNGDGGAATVAQLNVPMGVLVDSAGNLFIADTGNNRIRKVTGGKISTVAGTGKAGFSGDGTAATSAQLNVPTDVALDFAGSLYIADSSKTASARSLRMGRSAPWQAPGRPVLPMMARWQLPPN